MTYKPHRTDGYQRTMRVPGPIQSEEPPLRYWIIAAPILAVAAYLVMVLA